MIYGSGDSHEKKGAFKKPENPGRAQTPSDTTIWILTFMRDPPYSRKPIKVKRAGPGTENFWVVLQEESGLEKKEKQGNLIIRGGVGETDYG